MEKDKLFRLAQHVRYTTLQLSHNANESHTAGALSMADVIVTLYVNYLNNSPALQDTPERDRFILSKGHCCASLYALLAEMGYFPMSELMAHFAGNGTHFFAHASHTLPGVELSTGSLGHGLPVACGLALGSKRKGIKNAIYCLVGDGEMNEGSNWEAIMFAAHNSLDNLCLIIDKNKMQALGDTKEVLCMDPLPEKLQSFQWNVMRTSFINQLIEEARHNDKIFLLVGDLGYHVVEPFAQEFPNRFVNVGIAEQNMAGVAAGLAMSGYNVYFYSIGNFPTLRCLEQIRNDIAYHNANVKVVAVGAGYAYGSLGATHQATEEIGCLRSLPNMVVATPGDPIETRAITKLSANYDGPMYIRLGKAGEKIVHKEETVKLEIGDICSIKIVKENRKAVFACGNILDAAYHQIKNNHLPYNLFSVPFVKPMNIMQLKTIVENHQDGIITIEEHQKSCGMGSALIEILNDLYAEGQIKHYPKVKRIAIPDEFADIVGTQIYLREHEGLKII